MFCQHCGNKIRNTQGICVYCEEVVTPPHPAALSGESIQARKPVSTGPNVNFAKLVSSVISLSVGFWILYQFGVFGTAEPPKETAPTRQVMRQSFNVGYWRYTVNRALTLRVLGRGTSAERANGRFVVVYLTAENNDKDSSTLPSPVLQDNMGRQHSSKLVLGSGLSGEDLSIKTLNPGVSAQGYFVFDVPTDASFLQIVLSGGFTSKARAAVPLPLY